VSEVASHGLWLWVAVLSVGVTTVVTRCSFLVLGARARLPPLAERALRYAPATALAALIGPDLLLRDGHLAFGPGNVRLLAAAIAIGAWAATRNMVWTIAAGMLALTGLRLWG
jgi:branched-subunit amino acid transport protein